MDYSFPWENPNNLTEEESVQIKSNSNTDSTYQHKEFSGRICSLNVAVGTSNSLNEEVKTYIKLQSSNGFRVKPEINIDSVCYGELERSVLIQALKYILLVLENQPVKQSQPDYSQSSFPVNSQQIISIEKLPDTIPDKPIKPVKPIKTSTQPKRDFSIPRDVSRKIRNNSGMVLVNTKKFQELFNQQHKTIKAFSNEAGVYYGSVSNLYNEKTSECRMGTLVNLAKTLGVPVEDLIQTNIQEVQETPNIFPEESNVSNIEEPGITSEEFDISDVEESNISEDINLEVTTGGMSSED